MDDSRVPITITPASLIFCKVPPGFSCPRTIFENKQMEMLTDKGQCSFMGVVKEGDF